jgi:putative redox protein
MSTTLEASVELINDKIQFAGTAGTQPRIITDYTPPLGDGRGYLPLELFLISLATCLGGTIAPILRKMQKTSVA